MKSDTAVDVIRTATTLPSATPVPDVQIQWHQCDEAALRTIMAAFPEANWRPLSGGHTEWISGQLGGVRLTAFAADPEPQPVSRIAGLFPDAVSA